MTTRRRAVAAINTIQRHLAAPDRLALRHWHSLRVEEVVHSVDNLRGSLSISYDNMCPILRTCYDKSIEGHNTKNEEEDKEEELAMVV